MLVPVLIYFFVSIIWKAFTQWKKIKTARRGLLKGYLAFIGTIVAFEHCPLKLGLKTIPICGIITWMDLKVDSFSEFLKWRPRWYYARLTSSLGFKHIVKLRNREITPGWSCACRMVSNRKDSLKTQVAAPGTPHSPLSRRASKSDLQGENNISNRACVWLWRELQPASTSTFAHTYSLISKFVISK